MACWRQGVQLKGARIVGHLDLELATLRCPLRLDTCYLDHPEPVNVNYAIVPLLEFIGCHLAGLTGGRLTTANELDLRDSIIAGPVMLNFADIGSNVICSGSKLTGVEADGGALSADGAKVGGSILLDGAVTEAGAVSLNSADIAGYLICSGARLTGVDADGAALSAEGLKVRGSLLLNEAFTAAGSVILTGADIGGTFLGTGAKIAVTEGTYALAADGLKVGALVLDGLTADGTVTLNSADVVGMMSCTGARLSGSVTYPVEVAESVSNVRVALAALGIRVGTALIMDGLAAEGLVSLNHSDISGTLSLTGARLTVPAGNDALLAESIKVGGNVLLHSQFTAEGTVKLPRAHISGEFCLHDAKLAGRNGAMALDGSGMTIRSDMLSWTCCRLAGRTEAVVELGRGGGAWHMPTRSQRRLRR